MTALDVIVALEEALQPQIDARPRGWCGGCGLYVQLTPGGYLRAHSYFMREGKIEGLFSWSSLKNESNNRAVLSCYNAGSRPRKTKPPARKDP